MNKSYFKKICIGTAQFGNKYGISNKNRKTSALEAKKIIKLAKSKKINYFDTAESYGNSHKILGKCKLKNHNIITKIYLKKYLDINSTIDKFLKDLKIKKLYAILIHNPKILLSKDGIDLFDELTRLKSKGLIKKIGVSEYSVARLQKIINSYQLDIVSFPFNPFDNRLVASGLLKRLKKNNIEIHARSIFLQGLLLMDISKLPRKLRKWNNVLSTFENLSNKSSASRLKLCLDYVLSVKEIDKITLGVENHNQLKEILINMSNKVKKREINFKYIPSLSNPLMWL